jgi:hypothetical protein
MELKSLLYLLLIATPFQLLAQKISGQLINEFDKTPVFGVTVYSNGVPFAFSDQEGKFEIEDATHIKALTFSHLAFIEKTFKVSDFKSENQVVYLVEKTTLLDEVEITASKNPLTLNDIIKKSAENFIENYKATPYLVNANAKQIVMQNNTYLGYIEMDGLLYNFIPKSNNTFRYPFIFPKEYRKNTETLKTNNNASKNREMFNYFGSDLFREVFFTNFQSSNLSHPLFKKHKYTYSRLKDIEINGHEYYQIQFFQKKGIYVGRDLFNVYGEMLISKEDFSITRHKVSFDFDDIDSNEMVVLYTKKVEDIVPYKITLNSKIINPKSKKKNTFIQTCLTIDHSKTIEIKDITDRVTFNFNYYLDELKYDSNYWKQKSLTSSTALIDNYLKILSEKDFIEGDKQKILDTKSKYYTNEHERFRIEQIILHQEILKSIKL